GGGTDGGGAGDGRAVDRWWSSRAVLQSSSAAVEQCCSRAVLQSSSAAVEQCCSRAVLQSSSAAVEQ
ncbi:hypothetical protein Tco_0187491, partial [Tanacetum coccineum]